MVIDSAYIEITSYCNLNCKHCYNNSGGNGNSMSILELKKIVRFIKLYKISEVIISGGEPLLNNNIYFFVNELSNLGISIKLVTNGTIINSDFLACAPLFDDIQISLEGSLAEIHEKIRGENSYNTTIENIKLLQKVCNKVSAKTTISIYNFFDVENLIRLSMSLKMRKIAFSPLIPIGRAKANSEQYLCCSEKELLNTIRLLNILKDKYSKWIIVLPPVIQSGCPILNNDSHAFRTVRIDPRGNLYPCASITNDKYMIGNVFDSEVIKISQDYEKNLKEKVNERTTICNRCILHNICGGGCLAYDNVKENADFDSFCTNRRFSLFGEKMRNVL